VSRFVESGPVVVAEWTWTSTFTGESPTGPVKDQRVSGRGVSVVVTENGQIRHLTDYYDLPSFFRKAPPDAAKSNK
jgi:SnoaL-like polyketide cyclase